MSTVERRVALKRRIVDMSETATMTSQKESTSIKGSSHGGRRPGAGRPKGVKNARTIEIETRARAHAGDALAALLDVATNGENETARIQAATAILDRGYGKPRQALEHTGEEGGPVQILVTHEIIDPSGEA